MWEFNIIVFGAILTLSHSLVLKMGGLTADSRAVAAHPDGKAMYRLFHPAFPLEILKPYDEKAVERLMNVKSSLPPSPGSEEMTKNLKGLPWAVMPSLGVTTGQEVWSKSEIQHNFEKNAHQGVFVWAHKLNEVEKGCLIVNHWKKMVVRVTSYDKQRGARGVEICPGGSEGRGLVWPPLSLEMELRERHWQPIAVAPELFSHVFPGLPLSMEFSPWEVILVLLLSGEDNGPHKEELQALFDTGLSPRQGFIAYLRLLTQVTERAGLWEGVPEYRRIREEEMSL